MLRGVFQVLFFAVFFSVGAASLAGAVLCNDLIAYCRDKHLVAEAQAFTDRLESLNAEYDALLEQLENNPDMLKRIAPVTLGTEPNDPDTVRPRARAGELTTARKALIRQSEKDSAGPAIPIWLHRVSDPPKRIALFIAGASLVLISLVCFTPSNAKTD